MKHEMHLDTVQFNEMSNGIKIIESRLYDEKRQKIIVGDTIEFCKRPECIEKVKVKIVELHRYKNIKELVDSTPIEYWGPRFKSKEQLLNSSWHYTEEEIKRYGLLAIKIVKL